MHGTLALYRAYRPRTFAELVGQEHVARTLRQAIARGQVAHAYLFGGPRGTGKTSAARILARAVNCEGARPEPGEPCGRCDACCSIADGSAVDVLEIDAASNRGIEEIRELRERAHYAPARLRTKVYIVDEAHMLTSEAFNALLKTLEEPPPRTLFVLATTEPQRIPPTIVSRCQYFEFRRLTTAQVMERLRAVCAAEGIAVEDEALYAIARHARGGLRDALALLDQVRSFDPEGRVRTQDVWDLLGLPDEEVLAELTDAAAAADAARGLALIHRLYEQGREPRQVLLAWLEHLRHLLALQLAPDHPELVPAPPERLADWRARAQRLPHGGLRALVLYLAERESWLRWLPNPRLGLETAFLAACERLATGDAVAPRTAPAAGEQPPPRAPEPVQGAAAEPAAGAGSVPEAQPALAVRADAAAEPVASAKPHAAGPRTAAGGPTLAEVQSAWPQALTWVRRKSKRAYAVWQEGRPVAVEGSRVDVAFAHAFHCTACEQPAARELMEQALAAALGRPLRVRPFVRVGDASPAPEPGDAGASPAAAGAEPGEAALAADDAAPPAGTRAADAGPAAPPPAAEAARAGEPAGPGGPPRFRDAGPRSILDQAVELFGGEFVDPGEGWS